MARLDDGFATLIEFAEDPSIAFWEKTVTPPGIDGGGAIDTTTMRNTAWRTNAPKQLVTLTNSSLTVAYNPECYDSVLAMVNVNQLITITFPDGSSVAFWGYINTFVPGELTEGEQPTAEVEIIPTNTDDSGAEIAPNYTAA